MKGRAMRGERMGYGEVAMGVGDEGAVRGNVMDGWVDDEGAGGEQRFIRIRKNSPTFGKKVGE